MKLRICEFNVENLFVSMAYYAGEDLGAIREEGWRSLALAQLRERQKPLFKLWGLSKAILDIDADILMLVEVGGQESLENFNRYFLGGRYNPIFVEGNSRRGIDLGFLVRKSLPLQVEGLSNRETPVVVQTLQGRYETRFSRDVAELRLSDEQGLRLICLLVHLKSKLTQDRDIQGKDVRTAEAIALVELYRQRRLAYPETPILVGGDLNADLSSLELELVRRTDLTDFHDLLETPEDDRNSYVFFDYAGQAIPETIDYLLLSPHLKDRVVPEESRTYRYKGYYDIEDPSPRAQQERFKMPSDHYPLVVTLRID
jgi:predicted extracellular nuclease